MRNRGFTLVEVLISMLIMSMLTVLISTSIRTAVRNKKNLEAKIEAEVDLYDSLRVIKLDVEKAFHYQDVFWEIENLAIQQLEQQKQQQGQNQQQARPAQPRTPPIKLTQFLGENQSVHFTTLNHYRTKYNAPESDQMEVGYFVEGCDRRKGQGSTKCLWRRYNAQIDDEVDKGGPRQVVAYDVAKFQIEYRSNKEQDEWVTQWRSDNKGKTEHRDKFPSYVKFHLEIDDPDDKESKKITQTMVVRIAFPNNDPHFQAPPPGQQNGQQQVVQ